MPPRESDQQQRLLVPRERRLFHQKMSEQEAPMSMNTRIRTRKRNTAWAKRIWKLHFCVSLGVVLFGIAQNQGTRKYIPIEPAHFFEDDTCQKAFLNSMALSEDDIDATVCCDPVSSSSMCSKNKFPLANRLSRFPEAWLVPLIPWFLRLFASNWNSSTNTTTKYLWRRLALYFFIMAFRGFVLYQGMNLLEDHLLRILPDTCWYRSFLRSDQPACYGRIFDFSDHIVLYLAQILPLALVECVDNEGFSSNNHLAVRLSTVYLYLITLSGAYKTTAYFHTGTEMLAGYAVSLVIQIPLYWLQTSCTTAAHYYWFGDSS